MKSIEEIAEAYKRGDYKIEPPQKIEIPKDGIIDENESVKWNREEVERRRETSIANSRAWRQALAEKEAEMRGEVAAAIEREYKVSPETAAKIEAFTWEREHATMASYFEMTDTYATFAIDLIKTLGPR